MKKSLLALSALTIAAATNAHAADPYAQAYVPQGNAQYIANNNYGMNPYANQNGYATQAAGYQQAYQPASQQTVYNNPYGANARNSAYNNFEPAAGSSSANSSKWPFWYVGLNAGSTISGDDDWERGAAKGEFDTDNSIGVSAALGYKPSNFRYEVELGYTAASIDAPASNGDVKATKVMGNVLYDFDMNGVSPFLGAGLGGVSVKVTPNNAAGIDGADTAPAWQLIGGVSVDNVLPQTDVSLAYKYLDTFGDLKEDGAKYEYSSHTIEAGARLRF